MNNSHHSSVRLQRRLFSMPDRASIDRRYKVMLLREHGFIHETLADWVERMADIHNVEDELLLGPSELIGSRRHAVNVLRLAGLHIRNARRWVAKNLKGWPWV